MKYMAFIASSAPQFLLRYSKIILMAAYDVGQHIYLAQKKSYSRHSSEIKGLCLMKFSSEMLQNLPYFRNMNSEYPRNFFRSSFRATLFFPLMDALVYARNEERKKL